LLLRLVDGRYEEAVSVEWGEVVALLGKPARGASPS
jgi:hypothetical protein